MVQVVCHFVIAVTHTEQVKPNDEDQIPGDVRATFTRGRVIFDRLLEEIESHQTDQWEDEHVVEIHPAEEFIGQHVAKRPCAQTVNGYQYGDNGLNSQ